MQGSHTGASAEERADDCTRDWPGALSYSESCTRNTVSDMVREDNSTPLSNPSRDMGWLESMWDVEVQESKQTLQERVEATSDVKRFLLEMDRADAAKDLVMFEQQRSLR